MSELEKTMEKINGQFTDIFERINEINSTLKQKQSDLIEQVITEKTLSGLYKN